MMYGADIPFDHEGMTVHEPRANMREAFEYLCSIVATAADRGVVHAIVCTNGEKFAMRLQTEDERLEVERAVERYIRDREIE